MKIYYFNDEKKSVTIQTLGQLRGEGHNRQPTIDHETLEPQRGKMFEVDAPEGAIPWVKKWTNCVLLTYVEKENSEEFQNKPST